MAEYPSAPNIAGYGSALFDMIAGMPARYRQGQQDQNALNVQNAFKSGVPTNPDGTIDYAAAMQTLARAGDPNAILQLGPEAQQQMTPPGMFGGGVPFTSGPARGLEQPQQPQGPMQLPGAAPGTGPRPPGGLDTATAPGSGAAGPTVAGLVSSANGNPALASLISKRIGVDPLAPLTPAQQASAQRIMTAAGVGPAGAGQLSAPVRFPEDVNAGAGAPPPRAMIGGPDPYASTVDRIRSRLPPTAAAPQPSDGRPTSGPAAGFPLQPDAFAPGPPAAPTPAPPAAPSGVRNLPVPGGQTVSGQPDQIAGLERNVGQIESRGNYQILGPVTKTGDRAYGKYQVMGNNVGPWTREALGRAMTPEQFLNDPAAQDKVADFKMRQLAAQGYSPQDIASIWLTGRALNEGGATRRDQLGTSGAQYAAEATRSLGGEAPGAGAGQQSAPPQGGGQPIWPQPRLPPGAHNNEEGIAIYDREIARLASVPGVASQRQAQVLDAERSRLLQSMEPREVRPGQSFVDASGRTVYTAPYAGAGMFSPAALDAAVDIYHETGKLPPGGGQFGDAKRAAIVNGAAEKFAGEDPSTWPQRWQEFNARGAELTSGARARGSREANLDMILSVENAAIPAALEASRAVPRGSWVPVNDLIQRGKVATSDPDMVEFAAANLQLAEGWARAMNPTGVMRESDRDKALSYLSTGLSQSTYERLVRRLQMQIERERNAISRGAERDPNRATPEPGAETRYDQPGGDAGAGAGSGGTTTGPLPKGNYRWDPDAGVSQQ